MVALPDPQGDDGSAYDPTPEEIQDRSAAIRKRWSKRTRRRRRVSGDDQWQVPTVDINDVAANMQHPSES